MDKLSKYVKIIPDELWQNAGGVEFPIGIPESHEPIYISGEYLWFLVYQRDLVDRGRWMLQLHHNGKMVCNFYKGHLWAWNPYMNSDEGYGDCLALYPYPSKFRRVVHRYYDVERIQHHNKHKVKQSHNHTQKFVYL